MNEFFYKTRGNEKVNEMREEGLRSQALYKSGSPRRGTFHGLLKLAPVIAVILAILGLFVR